MQYQKDKRIMSTVEDLAKMQMLDDSNLNMPAIQQDNKKFFGASSKSSTGYRGSSAKNNNESSKTDRLAPILDSRGSNNENKSIQKYANNKGNTVTNKKFKTSQKVLGAHEIMLHRSEKEAASIYQEFNNAIRGSNYEAEQALQHYYQKSNPSAMNPVRIKSKDFVPLEGVSIAIHNRNNLHDNMYKKNSRKLVIGDKQMSLNSHNQEIRNPALKRHRSKQKVENKL